MSVAITQDIVIFHDSVVVITRRLFSENLFFGLVEKYKITSMTGPPIHAYNIIHHPRAKTADLSSIKLWGIGGYFVSDNMREAVDALLPNGRSYTIYGTTENGLIATDMMTGLKRGTVFRFW